MLLKGQRHLGSLSASKIARKDHDFIQVIRSYFDTIHDLEQEIESFEEKYDMKTTDLLRLLDSGEIRETADHVRWVFAYEALQREREWQQR